jgi:hypothetical protein
MDHPLTPLLKKDFDFAAAQHLLNRAGFGGTPQQVRALVELGLDGALDLIIEYDAADRKRERKSEDAAPARDRGPLFVHGDFKPDVLREESPEERAELARAREAKDEETR